MRPGDGATGDAGPADANEAPLSGTNARVFPAPGARGVCPDPPPRITFSGPPTLGSAGMIRVRDASGAVVAGVDMSAGTVEDTVGGLSLQLLRPVYVDGNDVVVDLKSHALAASTTYSVTVDAGAIAAPGGAPLAVTGDWQFTTAAALPSNPASRHRGSHDS